jgi:DNA-binding XRE family transcriptional regulator
MAKTLDDLLAKRPVDADRVAEHEAAMRSAVRAYRLRELREDSSLTQTDVARELSVSQKRVSKIEHGDIERTQVNTLRRYAEAVGGTLRVEVRVGDTSYQIA